MKILIIEETHEINSQSEIKLTAIKFLFKKNFGFLVKSCENAKIKYEKNNQIFFCLFFFKEDTE